jgi:ATP-dependent helicase/nuclease subunit A
MMNQNPKIPRPANDEGVRRRAIEETDRSFVVEASAGTGKTSTLIRRILHLVLVKGPDGSPLPLSRICAITFTEKAASEMKLRLRQNFEQRMLDERVSAGERERAREALVDLETASISTFHSFAVSLLKERPVEAELDPRFTALDDIQSELFFREAWEPWIGKALEERSPTIEKALRNGFTLEALKELAHTLRLKWLLVRDLPCQSPPAEELLRKKIQDSLQRGKCFREQARNSQDKLIPPLDKAIRWMEQPDGSVDEPSKPGGAGAGANWEGGRETVNQIKTFIKEVLELSQTYKNLPAQRLLDEVIRWIKEDFMKMEWEIRKKARGLLDFDDQLRLARDLLKKSAVRREFQARYATLLVDEFQDTDAVQWEMVLLLTSADLGETDPARLQPKPGGLFVVGDPKQSIYRFRNADIETYLDIVDPGRMRDLRLERLELTTNFRSVPSILKFVDSAFEDIAQSPEETLPHQPPYLPFGGPGDRLKELNPPSVSLLADMRNLDEAKIKVHEFIKTESRRIAKLIRRINGSESWKIEDRDTEEKNRWRVPRYGDMAILLPVFTHTQILEDALRDNGIPYVLEGGKFYYARSEVSSAISVLRAVANPNDSVSLYSSLRSIFFGLSDEDLLRSHVDGLPLDYRESVPDHSPLFRPYGILLDLHRSRHERRASETFEMLLNRTSAREVLAVRGFQTLANLNKLGRTLRALQGGLTFSQVVELLQMMDEEGMAESESRLMEDRSDAVRVLSIHKAKGLDFPVVFVAAMGTNKRARSNNLLADSHRRKIFALKGGAKDSGLQTPGWDELNDDEAKQEDAELIRILYVALTRARDHLILSTHTSGWKQLEDSDQWVLNTEGTRLKPLGSFLTRCLSVESDLVRLVDTDALDRDPGPPKLSRLSAGRDWRAEAEREYKELREMLKNTPSARGLQAAGQAAESSEAEDRTSEDRMPEAAERRGVRLGVAFHEAMERVDLFGAEGLPECARDIAIRHKLDSESLQLLESMMHHTLSSDLLDRARAAIRSGRRIFRELPFVRPVGDSTIEEGKIDLLFEEPEGWILVDYKTDWVQKSAEGAERFFREKYAGQITEYSRALQDLSVKVESAYLLLSRTGDAVKIL